MRSDKLKGFLMGVFSMILLIAFAIPVFASTGSRTLQASYQDIQIYIDGVLIIPKDANGNAVEPFIVNGTTYLPVRAVGQAFGKDVYWDGATSSVYIGSRPTVTPPSTSAPSAGETASQKNAVAKAKQYLNVMPFSHSGLVKQLEYEKFSHEDAVYGADNCGANWNEQAAKKAKQYLELMPFSRDSLIDQLLFDGFTREQAVYGVTAAGL